MKTTENQELTRKPLGRYDIVEMLVRSPSSRRGVKRWFVTKAKEPVRYETMWTGFRSHIDAAAAAALVSAATQENNPWGLR